MEHCILKVYHIPKNEKRGVEGLVRLTSSATEILNRLQRETGLTQKYIASELIAFASKYVEIKEITLTDSEMEEN